MYLENNGDNIGIALHPLMMERVNITFFCMRDWSKKLRFGRKCAARLGNTRNNENVRLSPEFLRGVSFVLVL